MQCQKSLFQLPPELHYLNCAYMSPMPSTVEAAGQLGMRKKLVPSQISAVDFFNQLDGPKEKFGKLINAPAQQIAFIPSVSYAMANVMNNIPCKTGQHALTVAEEFPSDFFALKKWATKHQAEIKVIRPAENSPQRGRDWNNKIIEAISTSTAIVNISSIHWMDGTLFDWVAIGKRCREVGAIFVVDGTQSVGALPIDVQAAGIHVLICASYKWLMGPYSIGLAYFHSDFNEGVPIEEAWTNRDNAQNFSSLAQYSSTYSPGAARYSVGESANFILVPMLDEALRNILEWGPANIQEYCGELTKPLIQFATEKGWKIDEASYRCNHLFGLKLPATISMDNLTQALKAKNIIISVRGNSIRIAPNVYNDAADINALLKTLKEHTH